MHFTPYNHKRLGKFGARAGGAGSDSDRKRGIEQYGCSVRLNAMTAFSMDARSARCTLCPCDRRHNRIALNIAATVLGRSRQRLRPRRIDQKLETGNDLYYYRDVQVLCDPTDDDPLANQQPDRLADEDYRLSQLRYDLAKLRAKGLVQRVGRTRRYRLTPQGARRWSRRQRHIERLVQQQVIQLCSACSSSNSASGC